MYFTWIRVEVAAQLVPGHRFRVLAKKRSDIAPGTRQMYDMRRGRSRIMRNRCPCTCKAARDMHVVMSINQVSVEENYVPEFDSR